jgi:AcrR family transcriptional regulator
LAQPDRAPERNLFGQRIGPKGRLTRERMIASARRLLEASPTVTPSLTAVAREAGVAMAAIYRYYPDTAALMIDALEPIRLEMEQVTALLVRPWPAGETYERALAFAAAHYDYWLARRGALFLRNSMAERGDRRFVQLRTKWAGPLVDGLAAKLAAAHGRRTLEHDLPVAGLVISGMERTTTLALQRSEAVAAEGAQDHGGGLDPSTLESRLAAVAQIITLLLRNDCTRT